jgi:hypothetical protein
VSLQGADRVLGGRYRLIREIARGGMAIVWEARDGLLDRHVAVKVLHPQFAEDPEFLERFRREARAAARLSHPNIVSIYDVGEDVEARTPFIVMELVEGGNLKDRIHRAAPLADEEIRSIGAAVASTLEYAHKRGLIHRDVKPQNVLLGEDGRPRLTDFGIAQAITSNGLTRTGAVMGSVQYLAPELARGRPATPQSDLYGLGTVLYEMATGRVPFQGETDLATALAHIEQIPPSPRSLNAGLAPDLERTILRAMAKSPDQRFHTAAEMASALRALPTATAATASAVHGHADGPTQRIMTVPAPPPPSTKTRARPAPPAAGVSRRTARPQQSRGAGAGVLVFLLALAAILIALGAGFFGLATLNREAPPTLVPTSRPATAVPTAVSKPAVVPSDTPVPAPSATPEPSATLEPSPSPVPPTPSPVPPSPTPQPQATPAARAIPVPQLRGKTLDAAQVALQSAGLTATVRGVNANVDKNVVTDQSPDVGATLAPGTTVTIVVGTGSTSIPDVANMLRDQALKTLQANSFHVTMRDRRDPRIPAGEAIETVPKAGFAAPRGSEVELDISAGR